MAAVHESVLDAIGGTPLFRLARLGAGLAAPVYAKAEFFNVGGSVKDRAALSMVLAAEREGLLKPGGTIVEATSGNTGIGLTIVGRQRGYRVIAGVSDRSAAEKSDILRAYGAEVVTAATSVPREDPSHLFNVVRRLVAEIPGAWLADQYDNPANPDAHLRTTGPEIWEQTAGRVTHFVAGVGTGGSITGTGEYLKRVSGGAVRVVGADPESSMYGGGDGSPWYVESIGHFLHPETVEDRWPKAYRAEAVDTFECIPDRESLLTARRLAREEGILAGPSSGTAVAAALRVARRLGPDDLVVVLLPDSGRSYLSKVHSDAWMRQWGFLEDGDGLRPLLDAAGLLVAVTADTTVARALEALRTAPGGVAPVLLARGARPYGVAASEVVGTASREVLAAALADGSVRAEDPVGGLLGPALPVVGVGQPVGEAREALGEAHPAVAVLVDGRVAGVLPRAALLA
ncbi:pyridoxal-phosphate dependent enzyme [Streptomyces rubellomurinus]|uniref:Cystathionine beta-synthase n=2 Tax=Streptomyces TaxID=1883 RepID=A0A0F2TKC9_STRR3|nr:pyridoxal-phosphate dependent enzyme [Streptomyces rubellomurinus]KJS57129.1 cystathionine beta-synthase [Streptomyces rubellomurinus subsp. indigoferus]KJS62946.1 cystathionine beta-synthase [Streptomyces rubellomurinus]